MSLSAVPFVDLAAQYRFLKSEVDAAIRRVLESCAFVGGEEAAAFEAELASYCAAGPAPRPHLRCVACANGTDAIYLVLRAMGVGPGDEVITVAHTFAATAEAIGLTGARPVFVDVLPDTMLMDPDAIEPAITPRTRAIVPVHLYGQPCDMDRVMAVARRHGLKVVEDAAQALGATWRGRRPGALGDAASFSFSPDANLGAYGDGGAVVSADVALIERVRMLADHGSIARGVHLVEGINSRLDAIQAAVLRVKLRYLDGWNAARQRRAALYLQMLRRATLRLPTVHPDATSVWHVFAVRTQGRDELREVLRRQGIATGVHYPTPLHLQPAYAHLGVPKGALPVTERAAAEVLSLPMYAELPEDAVAWVALAAMARDADMIGGAAIQRPPAVGVR